MKYKEELERALSLIKNVNRTLEELYLKHKLSSDEIKRLMNNEVVFP